MKYLGPSEDHYVIDIETDDLDATVIWVACIRHVLSGEEWTFTDINLLKAFIDERPNAIWIGHNIIGFDGPVLNRLAGTSIRVMAMVDTFVLSMLYSPSLSGGHSLEAWGERLRYAKIDFNDFSHLTPEMITYCMGDVRLTTKLFLRLSERMRRIGFTERGCEIEHRAWWLIKKQQKNGFAFDEARAMELYATIRQREKELTDELYKFWPPQLVEVNRYAKARKANGEATANFVRHSEQFPRIECFDDGSYAAYDYVSFNLGSPKQRVEKLLELGWVPAPDELTPKTEKGGGGNPSPTKKGELVPTLQAFVEESGNEQVKTLVRWIALNARANMINTWLDVYNRETGAIHGDLFFASTLRYRHSNPNTANIPAVRVDGSKNILLGEAGLYTYEARDLWVSRDPVNRRLVGVDAKGIQFRILAHYLGDKEFTDVVLGGDIHEYNRFKTGIGSRQQNKTFGYAALLGAGAAKTGSIFGVSSREGGQIKDQWIATVPGLKALYRRLEGELERTGRITLCDGTRVLVPSPHMVLAYLLQGDESRIMKQAGIFTDEQIRRQRLDVLKVGDIHDEWQSDVRADHVEAFTGICDEQFPRAGQSFRYSVPIECDHKVGLTWAQTH